MTIASVYCECTESIATVTLSNPGKLNSLNVPMWQELKKIMLRLAGESIIRCVILRGAGDVFAAGGDIEELRDARSTVDSALAYHEAVGQVLLTIQRLPQPTIAAIQGPCAGAGLEIACACDLRIAGQSARFGAPVMKLGFSMYPGELAGLLALAGPALTREILLEGRLLTAADALSKGLLTRVVPDADVHSEAIAAAQQIAAGAPLVARWHKQWIARMIDPAPLSKVEKRASFAFVDSTDYSEGISAFLEKRSPRFTGH